MLDIMLDLETLGTKPGCVVLTLGATAFGPEGLGERVYVPLSIADQEALDLVQDPDTVAWWSKQSAAARAAAFEGERKMLLDGLQDFSLYCARHGSPNKVRMWGNGADFDNPILGAVYVAAGMPQPWGPYQSRCYRTLKGFLPAKKLKRGGTHHNALDDAVSQAEHAVALLHELNLWGALR